MQSFALLVLNLLKRAAPGTLFVFFGVVMIAGTLWVSPKILGDYNQENRAYHQQLIGVIDARTKDLLALVKQLDQQRQGDSAQAESAH
jgi:hypothetical protein